jgi:hypothetical protein
VEQIQLAAQAAVVTVLQTMLRITELPTLAAVVVVMELLTVLVAAATAVRELWLLLTQILLRILLLVAV